MSDAVDDAVDAEGNRALAPTAVAVLTHIVTSIVDDPAAVTVRCPESRGVRLDVRASVRAISAE